MALSLVVFFRLINVLAQVFIELNCEKSHKFLKSKLIKFKLWTAGQGRTRFFFSSKK